MSRPLPHRSSPLSTSTDRCLPASGARCPCCCCWRCCWTGASTSSSEALRAAPGRGWPHPHYHHPGGGLVGFVVFLTF